MRRIALLVVIAVALLAALPGSAPGYTQNDLMESTVMNNVNSMSLEQIETLLSKSPCLAHYTASSFNWTGQEWVYGTESWSAARIIYEAAHFWGLNPQVTIAKLQEEESLVTGSSCDVWRYASAMGYDCPENGACNSDYAGFELQVLFGDFQIKFNQERSVGNLAYAEENNLVYSGFMLAGTFARCESCTAETYNGEVIIDGREVHLETAPTAALYSYTPHIGPVLNEMRIFESYGFGSTVAGQVGLNEPELPKLWEKGSEEEPEPAPEKTPEPEVTSPAPPTITPTQPAPAPVAAVALVAAAPAAPSAAVVPIRSEPKAKPKARLRCRRVVRRVHGKKRKLRVCLQHKAVKKP